MVIKIKKIFTVSLALLLLITFAYTPIFAASISDQIVSGGQKAGQAAKYKDSLFATDLINFLNILLTLIGIIFLALMIYGGYIWMLARGNTEEVTKAKTILKQAVVGFLVIVLSRILTEFILLQIGRSLSTNN